MIYYIIQLIFGIVLGLVAIIFNKKFVRFQKKAADQKKWFVNDMIGKKILKTPSSNLERNAIIVGLLFIILSVVNFILFLSESGYF